LFALTVWHLGWKKHPSILITIGAARSNLTKIVMLSTSEKEPIVAIRKFQNHTPTLAERAFVDHSAVVIGDVEIGADSSVWPLTVIRGDMHRIRIGTRTSVQDGSVLHITHAGPFNPDGFPLLIGDEVTIGHKVMLHGCTVGNRILIGMGTTIMDGAVVEDEVIIGAGSLVPPGKRLESGFLYVGRPVKQVRPLTEKEIAFFPYSATNYVKLKDQHLAEGFDQPC
jgi:carbonic anhydrase/acetyltransferase-like protein (isoleucine patch superfamily)